MTNKFHYQIAKIVKSFSLVIILEFLSSQLQHLSVMSGHVKSQSVLLTESIEKISNDCCDTCILLALCMFRVVSTMCSLAAFFFWLWANVHSLLLK
jgi:hypothetical protein